MNWLGLGLRILPYVGTVVSVVERFVKGKGKEKQDAALDMLETVLETVEGVAAKDLINDAVVNQAARAVVDAVVAFQNIAAKRAEEMF